MKIFPLIRCLFAVTLLGAHAGADMTNRWSFNEPAGNAAAGTAFVDTVGGATATIVGTGATLAAPPFP